MSNLGPMLLINVVLVAVGIGVYHVATAEDTQVSGDYITEKTTVIHEDGESAAPMLNSSTAVLERRVQEQGDEIDALKGTIAKLMAGKGGSSGTSSGAGGEILPAVELDIGGDEETPTFDEDTLAAFKKYNDEIRRRDAEDRLKQGLERQLTRLDVNLSDDQTDAVLKATMEAREKRMAMFRNMGARGRDLDEAGRAAFREEMGKANDKLKEEWSTTVYSLVPAADAEKIVEGMGRSLSFGGRGGFDRGSSGRNRNR